MSISTRIEIGAIERELRQLWKDSASEAAAKGYAVTRALTLNLVARARDDATAELISSVVQALTASHPNRTILVIERPDAPQPALDAFVQANCLLAAPGVPQVCGEQVTIDARGSATGQIASLVLPLLVPDLPVVLWLPGAEPLDEPLLVRLRGIFDRLIVDSGESPHPLHELLRLAEFDRSGSGPALSDLAWTRLTPWRELTAQFFDTRPLLPHLRRIDSVQLRYTAHQRANPVPALLLAGWLASSLGWTPLTDAVSAEGDTIRLYLRRPAVGVGPGAIRLVRVDIQPDAEHGAIGGLTSVHLSALDNIVANFSVTCSADPTCLRTSADVAGHPPIKRLAHVDTADPANLLAAELRLRSRDRTFSGALQVAGAFAARLGG
jgi:glucose-6-phosphate dehydrogenase assembly protein OpcA